MPDWHDPATYTDGPDRLLQKLTEVGDPAPADLQREVLGELNAYAEADSGMYAPTTSLPPEVTTHFHQRLRAIAVLLDPEVIRTHPSVGEALRLGLLGLRTGESLHLPPTRRADPGRGLDRVSYLVAGTPNDSSSALHRKTRAVELLGDSLVGERILWVPSGTEVTITGSREIDLPGGPAPARGVLERARGRSPVSLARTVLHDRRLLRLARRPDIAARYAGAWLLMDRDSSAQDNAEHLYRHLREHDPDVNAWFVLRADSPDWPRLHADGFRLLDHRSDEHYLALLNCAHLVSSQVDGYVVRPFLGHVLGPQRWRYTFLQHGVIHHDLSRWLNIKPIDLMVTSSPEEQQSVVGDGTRYELTDLESVQVGLARHDRLIRLGETAQRRRVLVTPTWRSELLGEQAGGNTRALLPNFWSSRYATAWSELLTSPALATLCERMGWELTFMPHPNMQDYVESSPLPAHVTTLRFDSVDVQQVFAEAAVWVTDYSSLAIEAALLQRPVVYFQFDRDEFYRGRLYQSGSYSHVEQGFGPVTATPADALAAIDQIAASGVDPLYLTRMRAALPLRDGRNCERTAAAIRAINSPRSSR